MTGGPGRSRAPGAITGANFVDPLYSPVVVVHQHALDPVRDVAQRGEESCLTWVAEGGLALEDCGCTCDTNWRVVSPAGVVVVDIAGVDERVALQQRVSGLVDVVAGGRELDHDVHRVRGHPPAFGLSAARRCFPEVGPPGGVGGRPIAAQDGVLVRPDVPLE